MRTPMHSASSDVLKTGRSYKIKSIWNLKYLIVNMSNATYQNATAIQSLVKLALALVWIWPGLGVEGCSSNKHYGDYRVVKKTDSDSDRVVVSLEEDTR
jgi:hypothetical protein